MLTIPSDSPYVATVVGIDPGTESLGCAILTFDIASMRITEFEAYTYRGSKMPGSDWRAEIFSDRARRIQSHHDNLLMILRRTNPIAIATESPFYDQRHPSAFGALTEIICAIRQAVSAFDVWRPLYTIDPPTVKRAVGAPGNAGKDIVKQCMSTIPELMQVCTNNFNTWDEHAIDAGAVAYCQYLAILASQAPSPK